jgi:hypothetical protein
MRMALVRYQSPDDSSFMVFDQLRFRVEHGLFLLKAEAVKASLAAKLAEQSRWNLEAMKLVQENRRVAACLEWLETLADDPDLVAIPALKDEPAIDLVANRLIADRQYDRVFCPACEAESRPEAICLEPWSFEEDGVTVRGQRSVCGGGHTLHVQTDEIDAGDLEVEI